MSLQPSQRRLSGSNPTTGIAGCCARAACGQATAAPLRAKMNSRRLTARYLPCFPNEGIARLVLLHCGIFDPSMSAWGQKQQAVSASRQGMSASPQKRTYASLHRNVRFVP